MLEFYFLFWFLFFFGGGSIVILIVSTSKYWLEGSRTSVSVPDCAWHFQHGNTGLHLVDLPESRPADLGKDFEAALSCHWS